MWNIKQYQNIVVTVICSILLYQSKTFFFNFYACLQCIFFNSRRIYHFVSSRSSLLDSHVPIVFQKQHSYQNINALINNGEMYILFYVDPCDNTGTDTDGDGTSDACGK